jgi:hypothetical protein
MTVKQAHTRIPGGLLSLPEYTHLLTQKRGVVIGATRQTCLEQMRRNVSLYGVLYVRHDLSVRAYTEEVEVDIPLKQPHFHELLCFLAEGLSWLLLSV